MQNINAKNKFFIYTAVNVIVLQIGYNMMKALSIILLFLFFPTMAIAQQQYVRKRVTPGFFIPQKELNRAEKLPPFPVWEEETEDETIEYEITAPRQTAAQATTKPTPRVFAEETDYDTAPAAQAAAKPESASKTLAEAGEKQQAQDHSNANGLISLDQSPLYQQKIEQYEKDLLYISKTGEMPENIELQTDLQKMNAD